LAQQLADRLDPDLLRAISCADFPALPIRVVARGRR
jgi:hypothetical protein